MPVYCDESGGVGRGVMTLAALSIPDEQAEAILSRIRSVTGLKGELKGSRIDLAERALVFELLEESDAQISIAIAISATKPEPGEDRGDHDVETYLRLIETAVSDIIPHLGETGERSVILDDGRYGPHVLSAVRQDVAELLGVRGSVRLALSHELAGLQLADVIANSFFNRALVSERQARMGAIVAPMLESGRIAMQVVPPAEH